MRINTNMAALNAWRNMTVNSGNLQKSLEKLSSGLRINRAADDAAGLAVSEKMSNQIRGTQMAIRNAQDGISLLQTAEGGLSETHSILQRMRELSVQSSTATLQDSDRSLLQQEFGQLQSEIDRIAKSTKFNGQVLLDGTSGFSATPSSASITTVTGSGDSAAGTYSFTSATLATQAVVQFGDIGNTNFASASATFKYAQSITLNNKTYSVTTSTSAQNLIDAINADASTTGVSATYSAGEIKLTSQTAGSAQHFAVGTNLISASITGYSFNVGGASGASVTVSNAGAVGVDATLSGGNLGAATFTATGNTITVTAGTAKGLTFSLDSTWTNGSSGNIVVGTNGTKDIQIGANISSNDKLSLSIGNLTGSALGIGNLSIATSTGSQAAVSAIDTAITTVSTQRATLGAYQNRLEHTVNSLSTASENLSAANSRIRDVDMAQEMANFTKNQILTQASTAMLAQANQSNQGVLSLLR